MEQLWVAYLIDEQGHVAYAYRHPTDAEVLAYAAALDGAKPVWCGSRFTGTWHETADPAEAEGWVIPLPDKETTDE